MKVGRDALHRDLARIHCARDSIGNASELYMDAKAPARESRPRPSADWRTTNRA